MASKLREMILSKVDLKSELVEIEVWGVTVLVRELTGKQRAKLDMEYTRPDGKPDLARMLPDIVIMSTFDPDTNERVFGPADRDAIADKSGSALQVVCDKALELSGLAPKSAEDAEKNSANTPNDA